MGAVISPMVLSNVLSRSLYFFFAALRCASMGFFTSLTAARYFFAALKSSSFSMRLTSA